MLEVTNIFCTIVNDCSGSLRSPGGGFAAHTVLPFPYRINEAHKIIMFNYLANYIQGKYFDIIYNALLYCLQHYM